MITYPKGFNDLDELTKQDIEINLKLQKRIGKNTFKNIFIGSGWLSANKDGKLVFTPIKHKSS